MASPDDPLYPTLANIPFPGPEVRVLRDGEPLAVLRDANAAFSYLAKSTTRTVSWLLLHGGYTCEAVVPIPLPRVYYRRPS